jgi:hypothetical protein
LDDKLVSQVDELSGNEGRAGFIRSAIESAVREALRWRDIEASAGMIENQNHGWDTDPAAWVREQRRAKDSSPD